MHEASEDTQDYAEMFQTDTGGQWELPTSPQEPSTAEVFGSLLTELESEGVPPYFLSHGIALAPKVEVSK